MTLLEWGGAGLNKVKPNFKHILARNDQRFENHALTFCYVLNYTKCILKIFTLLLICNLLIILWNLVCFFKQMFLIGFFNQEWNLVSIF